MAGFAQARGKVDQTGRHHQPGRIDAALRLEVGAHAADADEAAGRDRDIADLIAPAGGVDQPPIANQDLHALLPAMMDMTAMRTAMPKVTCGRMTLCLPSATSEWISTPRLIGPGCITIASGCASASFSGVRP